MDPEKQELLAAEAQAPETTQPAQNNAPAPITTTAHSESLNFEQKRDLIRILQKIPVAHPERYQKNALRRRKANIARGVLFFTLWLVQSGYVFKEIGNSVYHIIKGWMVKNCARHAEKAASAAAAAASNASKEASNIWRAMLITIPIMILIWVLLLLLIRPLTSTSRHIFFEGCAACFCVFQASTAALIVAARYMEDGVKDYYNMFNSTMFLTLLCLTAYSSVSYLEELELTQFGIGAPETSAPKQIEVKGDSQV